jgi:hypothetical protein
LDDPSRLEHSTRRPCFAVPKRDFREIIDGCLLRTEADPQLHNNGE